MKNFIYLGYINITMMQLEARVIEGGIRENETISILIGKRTNALKETFGTLKLKKNNSGNIRRV